MQQKEIIEPSLICFGYMLEEAVRDGWRISEQYPVTMFGGLYHVTLEKENEAAEKDTGHGDPPKPEAAKRGPKPKQEK